MPRSSCRATWEVGARSPAIFEPSSQSAARAAGAAEEEKQREAQEREQQAEAQREGLVAQGTTCATSDTSTPLHSECGREERIEPAPRGLGLDFAATGLARVA